MNIFAASESGTAMAIRKLLPKEIFDAVSKVSSELPSVLTTVKEKVISIEDRLSSIERNQNTLLNLFEELRCQLDPDAVPRLYSSLQREIDNLPTAVPSPTGFKPSFEVDTTKGCDVCGLHQGRHTEECTKIVI